jgi:regulator of RNase E activity RraA
MTETALFARMERELYSAVLSDALDRVGVRNHTANPRIRPLKSGMVAAGRAATILCATVHEVPEKPYEMIIGALDKLKPNEVAFLAAEDVSAAIWGELLSTASRARGARGAVIDGVTRDVKQIVKMNYPVFSTGITPTDSSGRADVVETGTTVKSGDAEIRPGDIVFADIDGVVVVPRGVEKDVLKLSFDKVRKENTVRSELIKGRLLRQVWEKHGVL